MNRRQLWEVVVKGLNLSPAYIAEGRGLMKRMEEEEHARTFHNIECSRLRGGECDCKMATTFTPPAHYTAIDGIRYSYPDQKIVLRWNEGFIQAFDGDDLIDEFQDPTLAVEQYPNARREFKRTGDEPGMPFGRAVSLGIRKGRDNETD